MLYDLSSLKFLFEGDHQFLLEVIKQFIADVHSVGNDISAAYDKRLFEQEQYHLHKIKSPLGNFGTMRVIEIVDKLEVFAQEKTVSDEHAQLIQNLILEIDNVVAALNKDYPPDNK